MYLAFTVILRDQETECDSKLISSCETISTQCVSHTQVYALLNKIGSYIFQ